MAKKLTAEQCDGMRLTVKMQPVFPRSWPQLACPHLPGHRPSRGSHPPKDHLDNASQTADTIATPL